jgi:hypothetical protein
MFGEILKQALGTALNIITLGLYHVLKQKIGGINNEKTSKDEKKRK